MVLPNLLKSPSQIPMFNVAPNAPVIDFNETLNRFKEELSRSLESSLGVQIKPNRSTYHKPYPSHFDFLKAPDGGGYQIYINSAVMIVDHLWSTLVCFLLKWVKPVPWIS